MLLNITQFIFHASFFKFICTATSYSQTFRAAKTSLEMQLEFVYTQYLCVVLWSRQ